MGWNDVPGLAGLVLGIAASYFTYRASRLKDISTSRKDAVEGFDRLAEDLRGDLTSCKEELRAVNARLNEVERREHATNIRNDDLERENEMLKRQLAGGSA
jgi:chromosome segregation ATPase